MSFLREMYDFLNENKADNRGFFQKEAVEEEESGSNANKVNFFENTHKIANEQLEQNSWDFYKSMYNMHKKKEIQKRMGKIKQ